MRWLQARALYVHYKPRLRAAVADRRNQALVRRMMRLASLFLNAAGNQYNWCFQANGEVWTVKWAIEQYGGVVFDVGSNKGQWVSASLPHCNGRSVHCFEPVPATFAELARHTAREATVVVNNFGLGAARESVSFSYSPTISDVSSRYGIPSRFAKSDDQVIKIVVVTGDEYCRTHEIDQIALLKIDVEGMEFEVLKGFSSMLSGGRVHVVQFEYGTGYVGARRYLKDVVELLESAGYAIFKQYPHELEPFCYSDENEDFRARNFVATLSKFGL